MVGQVVPFVSAARTQPNSPYNSAEQKNNFALGVVLFLDITAAAGTTPTLDVKLQMKDPVANEWHDIPGASFAQKTGTGQDTLMLFPGIAETANREVSVVLPPDWRVVATHGADADETFTFSVSGFYLGLLGM